MICALSILGFITPLLVPCPPPEPPARYLPPRFERRLRRSPEPPPIREDAPPNEYRSNSDDNAVPAPVTLSPTTGNYPHGGRVVFDAADYWSYTTLKFDELPPIQFDHEYTGQLTISDVATMPQLKQLCGYTDAAYANTVLVGCAFVQKDRSSCRVLLLDDKDVLQKWGLTKPIVLRHELGHCNGWSQDHEGAR